MATAEYITSINPETIIERLERINLKLLKNKGGENGKELACTFTS